MKHFCTDEEIYRNIRKKLKKELERSRYVHTKGVAATAVALAMAHGEELDKAYLAGLLHDNAKCIPTEEKRKLCLKYGIVLNFAEEKNPELIHAKLGAHTAREWYHIRDEEVLSAIACHTTGKPGMTKLEKIIYIADYIEPNRKPLPLLDEIRKTAFQNLEDAIILSIEGSLTYLKEKNAEIDPATMETYRYYKDVGK